MKKYFLIILTMAMAFVFSSYAGTNIFVANTPMVNGNYLADLQNKFKKGVNNIYLAFSIFNQKPVKKNIAIVYPTINMSGKAGSPTNVPIATKAPQQSGFAQIDPATIPANLFQSISKGVSAYEGEDSTVFRFEKGAEVKIGTIEVNGKKYQIIDLTGQ